MSFKIAYKPTILLIDAYNLVIRNYVVNPTMDTNGEAIGAVVGSLRSLRFLVEKFKPSAMFVVWDGEGSAERRRSIRKEYKEGRKVRLNREYDFDTDANEELHNLDQQVEMFRRYVDLLGIGQVRAPGVEADDVLAYLCGMIDGRKVLVSTDADLLQLVNEDVEVFSPIKDKVYRPKDVLDDKLCLASNYAIMKAICGDKGDNVEGVDGVGPKTLMKIVPELATEEDIGLGKVLELIEARQTDGKKKNNKAIEITKMREHIEENMQLVSLRNPLVSPDAARHARSMVTEQHEFRTLGIRMEALKDGVQLKEDFDKPFMMLASRTKLWRDSLKKETKE